jgi:hypothetical protein
MGKYSWGVPCSRPVCDIPAGIQGCIFFEPVQECISSNKKWSDSKSGRY